MIQIYTVYRYAQDIAVVIYLCYLLYLLLGVKKHKSKILYYLTCTVSFTLIYYFPIMVGLFEYPLPYNYFFVSAIIMVFLGTSWYLNGTIAVQLTYILFYFAFVKTFKFIFGPLYELESTMSPLRYQLLDMTAFVLLCITLFFLFRLFKKHSIQIKEVMGHGSLILALYCPASFLVILELADPENPFPSNVFLPIFAIALIINLPIIYYLYFTVTHNYEEKIRLSKALTETQSQLTRYRYSLFMQEELQKERHELKNKYFYIQTLLRKKEYEQLDQYLEDITGQTIKNLSSIETGNTLMDYLLNTKLGLAHKYNIKTLTEVLVPTELPVNEDILCTVLLNLLDNAIEASQKEQDPDIHITIKCVRNYLVCKISNKVSYDVLSCNPNLLTSKEDVMNHGLGTRIVSSTVKKCDGIYDVRMENNYFTTQVMLPLTSSNNTENQDQ